MKIIQIKSCKECPYASHQPLIGHFCTRLEIGYNKLPEYPNITKWCPLKDDTEVYDIRGYNDNLQLRLTNVGGWEPEAGGIHPNFVLHFKPHRAPKVLKKGETILIDNSTREVEIKEQD